MIDKEQIKERVLTENTAQGILNKLRELESNRSRMQKRWIWELMQNARDASAGADTKLIATVKLRDDELVFQHNGRGFTIDEVAHLIYHGSTKLEDERAIGQYGSGFLTTHLLSPEIYVSGQLNDGRPFRFPLKREIGSARELSDSMDRAWNEFDASTEGASGSFTTTFRYPVREESAASVEEGIATLEQCAPFVVVFNREFRSINIEWSEAVARFEEIERIPLQHEGLQTVTVRVSNHGPPNELNYLLADGDGVSICVPFEQTEDGSVCLPLGDIPRLFLGFPLMGTETFSFPAVINSFGFSPTENRDGVFLGRSDNEANQSNQAIFEEACELHVKLIEFVTDARWAKVPVILGIPSIAEQAWLNRDWLQNRLGGLISQIRQTPALLTGSGPIRPKESIVPFAGESVGVEILWDLLSEVKAYRQKLPVLSEADGWRSAVESWKGILDWETTHFSEVYDGTKLVSELAEEIKNDNSDTGSLAQLEDVLRKDVDAIGWLDGLYRFLRDDSLEFLLRDFRIVLNQAGCFDKLSDLFRDDEVDNDLKVIGDDVLQLGIRGRLRETRLTSIADEVGNGKYGNREMIREIFDKLEDLSNENTLRDEYIKASPLLLAWFVTNQQWNHLTGFPAYSLGPDRGSRRVLWMGQRESQESEVPLAPIKAWAQDLQQYADLFSQGFILAEGFFTALPDVDIWQRLSEAGYVRTDVLISGKKSVGTFRPSEPLPDGEHKTVDTVSVTDVFLLARDTVGVMARVRNSQTRARLFWRFLTEWLVEHDPVGLEISKATCECGDIHKYYPALWLVPVVENFWVPQGNDTRDQATAESLAKLLRGSGWTPNSLSDSRTSVELLNAIKVTRFDLMRHFVVGDDDERSALGRHSNTYSGFNWG